MPRKKKKRVAPACISHCPPHQCREPAKGTHGQLSAFPHAWAVLSKAKGVSGGVEEDAEPHNPSAKCS